jgi:hypothetical protein
MHSLDNILFSPAVENDIAVHGFVPKVTGF